VYAPDYVAGATARGDVMTPEYTKWLRDAQDDLAKQLGHLGRPGQGKTAIDGRPLVRCHYCGGRFRSSRPDTLTCSGACRQAFSLALSYEDDVDLPPASVRRSSYSRERALVTGFGFVNQSEGLHDDLRARRWARMFRRPNLEAYRSARAPEPTAEEKPAPRGGVGGRQAAFLDRLNRDGRYEMEPWTQTGREFADRLVRRGLARWSEDDPDLLLPIAVEPAS
jgi:hypothetical protein